MLTSSCLGGQTGLFRKKKEQFLLTCCGFLLSRTGWDPSKGEGGNAEASEVLGGVLDEPGEAAVHLEHRGRAVPHQLERVPLAVGQHCVPDGAFHLPSHASVRDVEDVAVSQLVKEISRGGMSATAAVKCREGKCNSCNFNDNLIHFTFELLGTDNLDNLPNCAKSPPKK